MGGSWCVSSRVSREGNGGEDTRAAVSDPLQPQDTAQGAEKAAVIKRLTKQIPF